MAKLALFGFLLVITTIGVYSWIVRRSCLDYAVFSYIRENAVLHGLLIKTLKNKSPEECEAECIDENFCKSINTENGGNRTCELNIETEADTTANLTLTPKKGWTFKSTNYSDPWVGENCKMLKPCPALHVCMDTCSCPGYECHKCRGINIGINCLTKLRSEPLGLQDKRIKDHQITASSYNNDVERGYKARLNSNGRWCAWYGKRPNFIRVDFSKRKIITDIAVQGHHSYDAWVTSYQLDFTEDMSVWKTYEEYGVVKILAGATTRNDVVKQSLFYFRAFSIKLLPKTWNFLECMRMEVYGIVDPQQPAQTTVCSSYEWPLGMESRAIRDSQITASSYYSEAYWPYYGRLNVKTVWCSVLDDPNPFLQVDLGTNMIVTAVAVQRRPDHKGSWTKTYRVSYRGSLTTPFAFYSQTLLGTQNSQGLVKDRLNPPINARFVRVIPLSTYGHRWCLRIELYGCDLINSA